MDDEARKKKKREYALARYRARREEILHDRRTNPATRAKAKVRNRAYYLAHKEQEKARRAALGKEYFRIASRKSYHKNRDRIQARYAEWKKSCTGSRSVYYSRAKSRYKLSRGQLDELIIRSMGRCDCCGILDERGEVLNIEHCHVTGRVRGMLCVNCNHSLGRIGDREEVLLAMLDYLRRGKSDEPATG